MFKPPQRCINLKSDEIRKMSPEERKKTLNKFKEDLWNLRTQKVVSGQLENPSAIRNVKRDIARVLTIMREEEKEGG